MSNCPILLVGLLLGACSTPALVRDSNPFDSTALSLTNTTALSAPPMPQRELRGAPPSAQQAPPSAPAPRASRPGPVWNERQQLMQGFIGVSTFDNVEAGGNNSPDVDIPMIGGGSQVKLAGERIDLGLEGLFTLGWRANASALFLGSGGAAIAVDTDLLLFEFYGGPFASIFLGKNLRAYGGVGPLFQFASYDQAGYYGSGFGYGYYTRAGLELRLPSRTWLGMGVRWSDSEVDLGREDFSVSGFQWLVTFSQGI